MFQYQVEKFTDAYFTRAYYSVYKKPGTRLTYVVFMRNKGIACLKFAIEFLKKQNDFNDVIEIFALPDGTPFESEDVILSYTGQDSLLMEIEPQLLQLIGPNCITALNASECNKARNIFKEKFGRNVELYDFHNRHNRSVEAAYMAAYAAFLGGFDGSSIPIADNNFWNKWRHGIGTTPHVMFGYYDNIIDACKDYIKANPNVPLIPLVDFWGREITDSIALFKEFGNKLHGVRLDTHGGRYSEGCSENYRESREYLNSKCNNSFTETYLSANSARYIRCMDHYIGKGVTVESVFRLREALDNVGGQNVKIYVSSGFNEEKIKSFAYVNAPIDGIGTGSFLPSGNQKVDATCDCIRYNDKFNVKVGREWEIDKYKEAISSGKLVKVS